MGNLTRRVALAVALLALTAWPSGQAKADLVVDQQNTASNSTIGAGVRSSAPGDTFLGQSFTPTTGSIGFATFDLSSSVASTFRVDLYSGDGYGGTLLGSSATEAPVITAGANQQLVEFDFASPITLTAGTSYTLSLVEVTGPSGALTLTSSSSTANPYAGGKAYAQGNPATPSGTDLVFSEGVVSTPEPSTIAMVFSAIPLGIGYWVRRRRRPA